MTKFEMAQIIIHEYDALRNEIMQNYNVFHQQIYIILFSIGSLIAIYLQIRDENIKLYALISIIIFTILFLYAAILSKVAVKRAAERIREIEALINGFAGQELLVWESKWGGEVLGHWGLRKPRRGG